MSAKRRWTDRNINLKFNFLIRTRLVSRASSSFKTEDFRFPVRRRRYVGHVYVDDARGNGDHHDQPGTHSDRSTVQVRTEIYTEPQSSATASDGHCCPAADVRQQIRSVGAAGRIFFITLRRVPKSTVTLGTQFVYKCLTAECVISYCTVVVVVVAAAAAAINIITELLQWSFGDARHVGIANSVKKIKKHPSGRAYVSTSVSADAHEIRIVFVTVFFFFLSTHQRHRHRRRRFAWIAGHRYRHATGTAAGIADDGGGRGGIIVAR